MTTDGDFFAMLAREFVVLIDDSVAAPPRDLSSTQLVSKLGCLLGSASRLQECAIQDWPDPPEREHSEYLQLYQALNARLPFGHYWTCLDPIDLARGPDTGVGDLADDIADIYFDLREGLHLFEAGFPEGAFFTWRQSFWSHWGKHTADAVGALLEFERR